MKQTHRTYCRNCLAMCGLKVEVEDNKILTMVGDRDHPLTKSYFCVKGLATRDLHNGEDRLRSSRKGRGASQADVAVELAMDEVAERFSALLDRHGPRSVAMYYGTGANFSSMCHSSLKGGLHMLGSPYIFSSMTLDQSAKWVAMGRMGYFAAGQYHDIDIDVGMLVGSNRAITHSSGMPVLPIMHNLRRWMADAKARGMKLIVVDPRLTETAKYADLHLQVRPGEDVALFAGLIRIVLERGWEDREFCAQFIEPLDSLRAAVDYFTLDYVAQRAGIPREQIEAAAQMFSQAEHPSAATGTGPNMGPQSNLAEHLVRVLNAICGGYRRAGDVVRNPGFLFGSATYTERVIPPTRSWEHGPKLRTQDLGRTFGEYPTGLLVDEIFGRGEDRIRALIVVGGNPVMALGDPKKTLAAFDQLELLVTLDSRPTETGALSDYVIATSQAYERFDYTGVLAEHMPSAYANVVAPFIERPPGVIDDWEFFWGLANRMRRPLELKRPMFGVAHEDIPGPTLTVDLDVKPTTQSLIRWFVSSHGAADYDELLSYPQGVLREDLATTVQPAGADDGARLDMMPADVAAELAAARAGESNAGFKYRLTVRRLLDTLNSAYRNASMTRARYPVNPAFMNPLDMAEEGIDQGAAVTISSEHGEVVAYARPDATLRRGVIGMTHAWGALDSSADPEGRNGAFTGRLVSMDAQRETINFMPRQSAIPVNVKPRILAA